MFCWLLHGNMFGARDFVGGTSIVGVSLLDNICSWQVFAVQDKTRHAYSRSGCSQGYIEPRGSRCRSFDDIWCLHCAACYIWAPEQRGEEPQSLVPRQQDGKKMLGSGVHLSIWNWLVCVTNNLQLRSIKRTFVVLIRQSSQWFVNLNQAGVGAPGLARQRSLLACQSTSD